VIESAPLSLNSAVVVVKDIKLFNTYLSPIMVSSKVLLCLAILPFVFAVEENQTWKGFSQNFTEISVQDNPSARCYDYRLANFINTGLQFYSHNMGQLSKYILDQVNKLYCSD
jgi:hypothetical protein